HLLDGDVGRLLPRFLGLLSSLVLVLPVVHDPTHGRVGLVGHLDEVEALLASHVQGLGERLDPDLGSVSSDQSHLSGTDPVVDSGLVVRRRSYGRSLLIKRRASLFAWIVLPVPGRGSGGHREADTRRRSRVTIRTF